MPQSDVKLRTAQMMQLSAVSIGEEQRQHHRYYQQRNEDVGRAFGGAWLRCHFEQSESVRIAAFEACSNRRRSLETSASTNFSSYDCYRNSFRDRPTEANSISTNQMARASAVDTGGRGK